MKYEPIKGGPVKGGYEPIVPTAFNEYEPIKSMYPAGKYEQKEPIQWGRSENARFLKESLPILLAAPAPQKKAPVKKPRKPRKQTELPTKFISLLPRTE